MKDQHTKLFGISTIVCALILGGCDTEERPAEAVEDRNGGTLSAAVAEEAVALETVTLKVERMTCAGCALGARTALQRLDGVEKAEVSYGEERAVVSYDPDRVTPEGMVEAIAEVGFRAVFIDRE